MSRTIARTRRRPKEIHRSGSMKMLGIFSRARISKPVRSLAARFLRGLGLLRRQLALDGDDAKAAALIAFGELDLVADRAPHERAPDRRLERHDVPAVVVLAVAEDPPGLDVAVALQHDLGAEADDAVAVLHVVHEARAREAQLEPGDQ